MHPRAFTPHRNDDVPISPEEDERFIEWDGDFDLERIVPLRARRRASPLARSHFGEDLLYARSLDLDWLGFSGAATTTGRSPIAAACVAPSFSKTLELDTIFASSKNKATLMVGDFRVRKIYYKQEFD